MTQGPLIVAALGFSAPRVEVHPLTGVLSVEERFGDIPASEAAALEHALRLATELDGTTRVLTVGGTSATDGLRRALAVGADEVLRIEPVHHRQWEPTALVDDSAAIAAALASALRSADRFPDLVLCGDSTTGSVPAFLAAELNAAQALGVVRLEPAGDTLLAHRRIDRGRREVLRLSWPAVVSVEAAGTRLRRASLPALLSARTRVIPVVAASAIGSSRVTVLDVRPHRPRPRELAAPSGTTPQRRVLELTGALEDRAPSTVVGPLPADRAADELLAYLERNGFLPARAE